MSPFSLCVYVKLAKWETSGYQYLQYFRYIFIANIQHLHI